MTPSAFAAALRRLAGGASLPAADAQEAVGALLDGGVSEAAAASFLTALHVRGESAEELLGAVRAIRQRMVSFGPLSAEPGWLDTCGTGGDGASTVNVSTATAVVLAACGVRVVKHGNRAASGRSGSSEVLDRLGVSVEVDPQTLRRCCNELGIAFLFAPSFHPGLRGLAPLRRQLPFRTVFNLVGPLCNPASPAFQLVGVPREHDARLLAEVLSQMESIRRAVVVTGSDGLDEVTLDGPTHVRVIEAGTVREDQWTPEQFGLRRVRAPELKVDSPEESAAALRAFLTGEEGPVRDIVLANAAAALWTFEPCPLPQAVARAAAAVDSRAAARLLARWSELTREAR
jgi:anthranilate phosphoribosyltransferase